MGMMLLDEAIKRVEEIAEKNEKKASWFFGKEGYEDCIECAKEHRQLAEWLKDYKRLLEQEPIIKGYCKDCKWQKDSDGVFRRGIDAESKCPMNRIEVFEGNGYCFLYEPKMRAESEADNGTC